MADLRQSFITETTNNIVQAKEMLARLTHNDEDVDAINHLTEFFQTIRCMAPFCGFFRCARLADEGYFLLNSGFKNDDTLTLLSDNVQRIENLVEESLFLDREPSGEDGDIIQPFENIAEDLALKKDIPAALLKVAKQLALKEKKITARLAELDKEKISFSEKDTALEDRLNQALSKEQENQICSEGLFRQEKELNEKQNQLKERENSLLIAENDLEQKKQEMQNRLNEAQSLNEECRQRQETLNAKEEELKALESEMKISEQSLLEKIKESEALKEEMFDKMRQSDAREQQNHIDMEKLRFELDDLKKMLAVLQEKYAEKMQHNAELNSSLEKTGQKKEELKAQIQKIKESLNVVTQERNRLHTFLEKNRDKYALYKEKAVFLDALPLTGEALKEQLLSLIYALNGLPEKEKKSILPLCDTLKNLVTKYTQVSVDKEIRQYCQQLQQEFFAQGYRVEILCEDMVRMNADVNIVSRLLEVLRLLLTNAVSYSVCTDENENSSVVLKGIKDGDMLSFSIENKAVFDMDAWRSLLNEKNVTSLSDEEAVHFLLTDVLSADKGLPRAEKIIQNLGGRIEIDIKQSTFRVIFSVPPTILFSQALIFSVGEKICALPLSFIEETKPLELLQNDIVNENGTETICWRGLRLPLVSLERFFDSTEETASFVIIVKTGAHCFAVKVNQVMTTEEIIALKNVSQSNENPLFVQTAVLANAQNVPLLDFREIVKKLPLPVYDNIPHVVQNDEAITCSFLVYKTSPEEYQAVSIDDVLCIENFSDYAVEKQDNAHFILYQNAPLKVFDSARSQDFFFARSLLILKEKSGEKRALAIQEVIDIVEILQDEVSDNCLFYRGKALPIISFF